MLPHLLRTASFRPFSTPKKPITLLRQITAALLSADVEEGQPEKRNEDRNARAHTSSTPRTGRA